MVEVKIDGVSVTAEQWWHKNRDVAIAVDDIAHDALFSVINRREKLNLYIDGVLFQYNKLMTRSQSIVGKNIISFRENTFMEDYYILD